MDLSKGALLAPIFLVAAVAAASATPVYLNESNMTVALGPSHAADAEPFANHTTAEALERVINAPSADSGEAHVSGGSSGTHIWISDGTPLELVFDLLQPYDLTALHFWNYWTESYDVDEINFTFYSETNSQVGTLDFFPGLGTSSPETAQHYTLSFPERVQFVNAIFTGTNGHIDFNNVGFTGELSPSAVVPLPASGLLLFAALGGLAAFRRARR